MESAAMTVVLRCQRPDGEFPVLVFLFVFFVGGVLRRGPKNPSEKSRGRSALAASKRTTTEPPRKAGYPSLRGLWQAGGGNPWCAPWRRREEGERLRRCTRASGCRSSPCQSRSRGRRRRRSSRGVSSADIRRCEPRPRAVSRSGCGRRATSWRHPNAPHWSAPARRRPGVRHRPGAPQSQRAGQSTRW